MSPYQANLEFLQDFFCRDNLTFLSSFPRSGNTWARHLVADVILQNEGMETQTELPIHPDRVIPDIHSNSISDRDVRLHQEGLIVKSHDQIDKITSFFGNTALQRLRHLYIIRQPEDALVSFYHFHLRYEALRGQAADGVDSFCLRHLDSWLEHTENAISYHNLAGQILIISYEELLRSPETSLAKMLTWLEVASTPSNISAAVEHMRFANLRKKESRNPSNINEFFFRKGVAGSGTNEIAKPTLEAIRERSAPVIAETARLQLTDGERLAS